MAAAATVTASVLALVASGFPRPSPAPGTVAAQIWVPLVSAPLVLAAPALLWRVDRALANLTGLPAEMLEYSRLEDSVGGAALLERPLTEIAHAGRLAFPNLFVGSATPTATPSAIASAGGGPGSFPPAGSGSVISLVVSARRQRVQTATEQAESAAQLAAALRAGFGDAQRVQQQFATLALTLDDALGLLPPSLWRDAPAPALLWAEPWTLPPAPSAAGAPPALAPGLSELSSGLVAAVVVLAVALAAGLYAARRALAHSATCPKSHFADSAGAQPCMCATTSALALATAAEAALATAAEAALAPPPSVVS